MDMKEWLNGLRKAERKKAMPILSFPAVQLMGITVKELISSSEMQAEGMKRIADRVDAAAAVSLMDLSVEAECFGSQIVFSEDEVPTVRGSVVSEPEDVEALAVPQVGTARTGIYVDAIRKAKERITDRPVFAGMIGPYSLAGRLLDVTEIEVGENMFLLNKYAISGRITSQLPYVQSVQIRRGLPDTIYIRVEECTPVMAVVQGQDTWLVSRKGKLLEKAEAGKAGGYLQVAGVELLLPTVASTMELPQDGTISKERLLELVDCLEERGMLADTEAIDCSEADILVLRYAGRFDVEIPYDSDFDKKLYFLEQIVDRLEENERGTVILTMPDKGSFKPAR